MREEEREKERKKERGIFSMQKLPFVSDCDCQSKSGNLYFLSRLLYR